MSHWKNFPALCNFSLLYGRRRYYASSERVLNLWNTVQKKQKQAIIYISRWICKIMRPSNNKKHINPNCPTLLNEMLTQEGLGLAALKVVMDLIYSIYVLIIVLNPIQTYSFIKKLDVSAFYSKRWFFYETYLVLIKDECMKLELN